MRILYILLISLFICNPSYAKRLDEMNANTSPDITNDLIYSQDVSDTSEASTGTGKSLTIKNLLKAGKITVDGTNVGINTISPMQQLQVVGTVQATAFIGDGSGLTGISGGGASVSDTAYGVSWDGDTTVAPSKNAVYDKIETISGGGGSITIGTTSPMTGAGTGSSFTLGVDQSLMSLSSIGGAVTDAQVPNNITIDLSATATALASNPTGCSAGDFVNDIAANGTLSCGTPTSSSGGWTDSGTTLNPTTSTDAVGIGTTSAIGRLTISGQRTHYLGCSDSIATAVSNATAGDTIILGSCTYTISSATAINKALTIKGQGPTATVLDSGATSSGIFTISASNVTLSDMKMTGTNVTVAVYAGSGASSISNIIYDNLLIDVSTPSGGTYGIINVNASGSANNLRIFNTTGSGVSGNQNRSFSVLGDSGCTEDVVFYVKNVFAYSKSTSSSWDGGRMRAFMLWNNSADTCVYDVSLYLSNSVGIAEVPPSTAAYGTEAINCQGPNATRNYGVVGGHYCYIYNTILDGGVTHTSRSTGAHDIRCDDHAQCYLENVTLRRQAIQNQNSAVIYRRGSINAAGLVTSHAEDANVLVSGAPGILALGQDAGNETQTGVRTGLSGGYNSLSGGTGSSATGTDAAKTGGSGGYGSITGGTGGSQTDAAPTNTGGTGGSIRLTGGVGGDASGGTTNNGGNGGSVYIRGGVPGTGADANGLAGNVLLGTDVNGLLYGNVGIGTATRPGSKFSVVGGSSIGSSTYYQTVAPSNGLIVSGNVGVGTINPSSKFHVVGGARVTGLVSCDTIDTDSSGNLSCGTDDGGSGSVGIGTANTITFWPTTTTIGSLPTATYPSLTELSYVKGATSNIQTQIDGLSVGSGGWTDGGTNVFPTATTDKVGIGTTTPFSDSMLTVKGSTATGTDDFIGLFVQNGVTPDVVGAGSNVAHRSIMVQGDGAAYIGGRDVTNDIEFFMGTSTLGVGFGGTTSNHPFQIRANGSSKIQVGTDGNVGIGTAVANARLTVFGTSTGAVPIQTWKDSGNTQRMAVLGNGTVGIGTAGPRSMLDVAGDVTVGNGTFTNTSANEDLYVEGNLEVDGTIYGDGSQLTGISAGGWVDGGTNVYVSPTTDNVGIGTTTPSTNFKADVRGNLYVSGNVGIGTLLPRGTLDLGPTGTIYTQTITGPTGPTILGTSNNVGIGTITAGSLLTVGTTGQAAITSAGVATLPTPILTGKIDINNVAVNDDDCTGEQGLLWYDSTDSAFEFCKNNSGTPERLGQPSPPASQTITAGATITADACGTFKDISSAGAVTTDTTNTFTAPSSDLSGCCMNVVNTGANNITLDNNSLFYSAGAADVVLGLADSAIVCTNGTVWAQMGGSNN